MATIDSLTGNAKDFAVHLTKYHTHKHLHAMINRFEAPESVCEMWKLSEDDYFEAVELAYFSKLDEMGY